jgi:FkbM family methyltransferase
MDFIKIIIKKILLKIAGIINYLGNCIYQYPQEKRIIPWLKVQGDKTHRLDYDLDENSLVFDLGGYEGQWSSDIFARYCCNIYLFEPVPNFAEKIQERFKANTRIRVYNFGLAETTKSIKIYIDKDCSSAFKNGKEVRKVQLIKASEFFEDKLIQKIDLMKINIEGGEYELLLHLIESGWISKINNIQVQFHDFIDNAEIIIKEIQKKLAKTHYLTYQYPFVWENWKLKV